MAISNGALVEKSPVRARLKPDARVAVSIPALDIQTLTVRIVGVSPYICHAWDAKTSRMMLGNQTGEAKAPRKVKDPWADFCSSLYWITRRPEKPTEADVAKATFGIPATAFKAAMITAAPQARQKRTIVRSSLHVVGEFVRIIGPPPHNRQDMVRVGASMGKRGVADIRFRAEFKEWRAEVTIRYNASVISPAQIVQLIQVAGFGVGVGEMRPELGSHGFGMFAPEE